MRDILGRGHSGKEGGKSSDRGGGEEVLRVCLTRSLGPLHTRLYRAVVPGQADKR